jgi:hypothetical protein
MLRDQRREGTVLRLLAEIAEGQKTILRTLQGQNTTASRKAGLPLTFLVFVLLCRPGTTWKNRKIYSAVKSKIRFEQQFRKLELLYLHVGTVKFCWYTCTYSVWYQYEYYVRDIRVADPGCLFRIPILALPFSDPGSRISNPGFNNNINKRGGGNNMFSSFFCSHKFHRIENYFILEQVLRIFEPIDKDCIFYPKFATKIRNMGYGSGIRDPGNLSRIEGSKKHRIPNPRSEFPTLEYLNLSSFVSPSSPICKLTSLRAVSSVHSFQSSNDFPHNKVSSRFRREDAVHFFTDVKKQTRSEQNPCHQPLHLLNH